MIPYQSKITIIRNNNFKKHNTLLKNFLKIINSTLEDNSYLGDDCAYLAEENLCVSTDALVEDVHFSMKYI